MEKGFRDDTVSTVAVSLGIDQLLRRLNRVGIGEEVISDGCDGKRVAQQLSYQPSR